MQTQRIVKPHLLITADDRTGALETGGACADLGFRVRLDVAPGDECALIDVASRHLPPLDAGIRVVAAHDRPARFRCHKMDSGLRGNWAHEVAALLASGRRIGVLASFPDAGRQCRDGIVFVDGVPVADTPLGRDPRSPLPSSRPADYLQRAGCDAAIANGDLRILDAADNEELAAAAMLCRTEGRMLVGTTGAIRAYAATLREPSAPAAPAIPRPALILCGSLHPLSRRQIAALGAPAFAPDDDDAIIRSLLFGADAAVATPEIAGPIEAVAADAMATSLATKAWRWLDAGDGKLLVVLGGDTAAAVLGERSLRVLGSVDTGVPLCETSDGRRVVTKGGAIGRPDTLARLLARR